MKKVISVLCAVCLLIGIVPLNTMAFDNKVEQPHSRAEVILENSSFATQQTAQMVKTIETDLKNLACFGADPDKVEINSIEGGKISYSYPITEEVTDVYTVTEQSDGTLVLDVIEGQLSDRIEIHTDGKIYINGMAYSAGPLRMANEEYQSTPFGSASAYTRYIGADEESNVPLKKKIIDSTVTAIMTALGAKMGIPTKFMGLLSGLASSVISGAYTSAPESTAMSYRRTIYERNDSIGVDSYRQFRVICWTKVNFTGSNYSETYYRHYYFT